MARPPDLGVRSSSFVEAENVRDGRRPPRGLGARVIEGPESSIAEVCNAIQEGLFGGRNLRGSYNKPVKGRLG